MQDRLIKWFRSTSSSIINSIAFYPALLAITFLALGVLGLWIDYSSWGMEVKSNARWLTLKDASTARTIVATIAAGIISLSVFSFSLVMIVLNQTAASMSNRILETLIGNTFQQIVLGFYIGTIVYSFFLLSTIRDIDPELYVPALSIYFLIFLTIVDIFLFIYFLHYITQSVKYDNLIRRIYRQTRSGLEKTCTFKEGASSDYATAIAGNQNWQFYLAKHSGYLQGSREENLVKIATSLNCRIRLLHAFGSYVLEGTPLWSTDTLEPLPDEEIKKVNLQLDIFPGQSIVKNPFYGFQHLMEVGLKALSPGINDPGTAVLTLHALDDLLAFMMKNSMKQVWHKENGEVGLILPSPDFSDLFKKTIFPIWDYGKSDRMISDALIRFLEQLAWLKPSPEQLIVMRQLRSLIKENVENYNVLDPDRQSHLQRIQHLFL